MTKQITAAELAEIVTNLLTKPEAVGEEMSAQTYSSFMRDIAAAVADHCGGMITGEAKQFDGIWMIGVKADESLPECGGIWAPYDTEGSLEEPSSASDTEPEHVTEILLHDVAWFLRDQEDAPAPTALDEASIDEIERKIIEGYREGELCSCPDADGPEFRGWWHIKG